MKNVMYHFSEPIAVHIIHLQGTLTPTRPGAMVVFDDKNSFILNLDSAEITISCNSLAEVMNRDVFEAADAPIKSVTIASKRINSSSKVNCTANMGFRLNCRARSPSTVTDEFAVLAKDT